VGADLGRAGGGSRHRPRPRVVLVFPSVTGGMTAISVGYVVCLAPLIFILYRLPGSATPPPGSTGAAASGAGGRPDVRALPRPRDKGFGLVFIAKFLITLAETIALLYLYYYLQDVVHYPRTQGDGQLILILNRDGGGHHRDGLRSGAVADLSKRLPPVRPWLSSVLMAATGFPARRVSPTWALVLVCAFHPRRRLRRLPVG